ncbi:MAG: FAD-binding oxidoreductase [Acidobacteriota bacterium]
MSLHESLVRVLGEGKVSEADLERRAVARDMWPRAFLLERAQGVAAAIPACVVWPESDDDVVAAISVAREERVPIVPYGGGSGVVGGATPPAGSIVLDMKRMARLVAFDAASWLVTAEAGIMGENLERELGARGGTLSHFPSSIYCSTLGGWIAARSSGQLSTRYGSIERRLVGLDAVLGTGERLSIPATPRTAAGPDLLGLFAGSEGTLGVITRATLRAHPEPAERCFHAYRFEGIAPALDAIRTTLQSGIAPACVRLYDELDTLLGKSGGDEERKKESSFFSLGRIFAGAAEKAIPLAFSQRGRIDALIGKIGKGCVLVTTYEGAPGVASAEDAAAARIMLAAGGKDEGPGPARHWWEHRYDISFKQSEVIRHGGFVDTIEVAAPWSRLMDLYRSMRATILEHALVMAHFSHAYTDGCSIYFTVIGHAPTDLEKVALYDRTWTAALAACHAAGATVTHHHGVGRLKVDAFRQERRAAGMALLARIKTAFDPDGILNPGALGVP